MRKINKTTHIPWTPYLTRKVGTEQITQESNGVRLQYCYLKKNIVANQQVRPISSKLLSVKG